MSYFSRKNRILIISYDVPPKGIWGVADNISKLHKHLSKDYVIDIASRYQETDSGFVTISTDKFVDDYLLINKFRKRETYKDFELLTAWNLNLAKRIKEFYSNKTRPSLIHCHSWLVMLTSQKVASYYKIPLVYTAHFLEKQYQEMKEMPTIADFNEIVSLENNFFRRCDALIVFGNKYKNLLIRNYKNVIGKIHVIPHGVEINKDNVLKENNILFVGRLVEEKGILIFLEAAKELRQFNYKFVVIGTGPLGETLRTKNDYENIIFKGQLPKNILYKEYSRSKIYCSLSHVETFGLTKVEAALAQNVIITTQGPKIEEIFPKKIVFSIPVNNKEALIKVLLKLMKSDKLVSEKGSLVHKFAKENYSVEKMTTKTGKLYENLLKSS